MLIGITGKRGCGKSTAANVLIEEYGFKELSFAEPLKEVCKFLFGLSDNQVYGDYTYKEAIDERLGVTPRKILQKFGTDIMRIYIHEVLPDLKMNKGNLWVHLFEREFWRKPEGNYVIADVRFPNEARAIRRLGGIILRIERPGLILEKSTHPSELEMDKISPNYIIVGQEKGIEHFKNLVSEWYAKNIKSRR